MKTPLIEGLDQYGLEAYLKKRQYEDLYWPTFFPIRTVDRLDGKTLIGSVGNRLTAYIIAFDAKAPEISRKSVETKYFDIPKIAVAKRKGEKEVLEHNLIRKMRGNDPVIEDIFNDVDAVFDAVMGRAEHMVLGIMSTTKYQLTLANNPLGIVNETILDFGMPAANKKTVAVIWSAENAATMTPITDFKAVVKAARTLGITFRRILMDSDAYDLMVASTEFTNAAKQLLVGEGTILGRMSLDATNLILRALRLPEISLVEQSLDIESNSGVKTAVNPWSTSHILFVPDIQQGNMFNGPIAEELEKPDGIVQAKRGPVLISVQKAFNPVSILTKAECNMFPSWPTIDRCFNLYTGHASVWA